MSFQELQAQNIDTNNIDTSTINHQPYPPTGSSGSITGRLYDSATPITLTAAQVVAGYVFIDTHGACAITLPSSADLNALLGFTIADPNGHSPAQTFFMWMGINSTAALMPAGPVTFTAGTGLTLQNTGPMNTSGFVIFRYVSGNQFIVSY
jgi:hypothetical protein